MRIVLFAALVSLAAAPLAAQNGSYLVRLGNDTLAVEKFTRTATRLEGEMATHVPRAGLRRYAYEYDAGGAPRRAELTMLRPDNPTAPPMQTTVVTFTAESAFVETHRDTAVIRRRVGLPHANGVLAMGPYAAWEVLASRVLRSAGDSITYDVYGVGSTSTVPISAWRIGRDSVGFRTPWDVYHARVERDGRILGSVPQGGTTQFAITRLGDVDPRAVAARWSSAEAGGQAALGQLSARDTVRATVAGAQLMVDYGRPMKRGRDVFGAVVPWGSVWRTGANAATQFRTDRALEMGGVTIPAGFYTLWTIPTPAGWKLLINSETGQWGTDHKADRDLYQIDMTVSRTAQTVERFTISVVPGGQGGTMHFEWDGTRASIPFTVRP